jgi:hypothetical protein
MEKFYAIVEPVVGDCQSRYPLMHGRPKSIVFGDLRAAERALSNHGKKLSGGGRGLIFEVVAEGNAFCREPRLTMAI